MKYRSTEKVAPEFESYVQHIIGKLPPVPARTKARLRLGGHFHFAETLHRDRRARRVASYINTQLLVQKNVRGRYGRCECVVSASTGTMGSASTAAADETGNT